MTFSRTASLGLAQLAPRVFQQVMSLGPNCRPKANIQHAFGKSRSERHVFDWQVTPISTLLNYLRCDFKGFFEREDLFVDHTGLVHNIRHGTWHNHEFARNITEAELSERYAEARAMHEKWCDATRRALDNRYSTLFVFGKTLPTEDARSLSKMIADRSPSKQFEIISGPDGDIPDGADSWKGDQDLWLAHLSPYRIELPLAARFSYLKYRWRKSLGLAGIVITGFINQWLNIDGIIDGIANADLFFSV